MMMMMTTTLMWLLVVVEDDNENIVDDAGLFGDDDADDDAEHAVGEDANGADRDGDGNTIIVNGGSSSFWGYDFGMGMMGGGERYPGCRTPPAGSSSSIASNRPTTMLD